MNSAAHLMQDEWLVSYAAGSLTPARSLMIAAHSSYSDQVQEKIADAESIGGALLAESSPADVDHAVLEQLLDRIDSTPQPVFEQPAVKQGDLLPPALAEHVGTDIDALKWRFMGPGMSYVRLWNGPNDERLWLLRADGGVTVPDHGHSGDEWTLLLKGSYRTEFGHYRVGDMDVANDEIEHQPIVDDGDECVCLVMTEGPLRMKTLFSKMAQPIIGL